MKRKASRAKPAATPATSNKQSIGPQSPASLPDNLTRWPGFMLAWVSDMASGEYAQALATIGIKPPHLAILTLLKSEGAMVQARLGDRLSIVKPTVVGLVNELEAMGLVERRLHPSDGRAFEVYLLEAGVHRIQKAELVSRSATSTFFGALKPNELRLFQEMLARLASSAQQRASSQPEESS